MNETNKRGLVIFEFYDYQGAALVIFFVAFTGTVCNSLVAFYTRKLATMNNAFGRLTASQSTGEAVLCSVFAFFYFPMVFFDINEMRRISNQFGFIALICYDICIFSHLFIALNRMAAICLPLRYDHLFNKRNTNLLIVISWVVPITVAIILYKLHDCDFVFSDKVWAFIFTETEVCKFISWYVDFYKDISIVSVIAVVDIITITKVRLTSKQSRGKISDEDKRKKEINFLKQAVLQGIVFVVELFTYFLVAWKFENKWIIWSQTTLAWNLVHTTDALIIIGYNAEFRRLITTPLRKLRITSHSPYEKSG